jgi:ligand-binding sensor domain-containing protein
VVSGKFTTHQIPVCLITNVTSIAIDGQGNLWIGTWGRYVVKFDGVNWTVYYPRNSGLLILILQSAIDGREHMGWISYYGYGGLAKFDGVNWTVYNNSNSRLP